MTYDYLNKKIVAIISDKLPAGKALNALGHIAFSAGRYSDSSMMGKPEIADADGNIHRGISKYPFIILKASEEELKAIVSEGKKQGLLVVDYPQEMFDTGPDEELVVALSKAKEPTIVYHAAVLSGEAEKIKMLTNHLKLYK